MDDDADGPTPARRCLFLHPSSINDDVVDDPFPYAALSVCIYVAWCGLTASVLFFILKERLRSLALLLGVLPFPPLPSPPPKPPSAAAGELHRAERCCCSICMEEMVSGEEQCMLPRCRHVFHRPCAERWLRAAAMTCPLCRSGV